MKKVIAVCGGALLMGFGMQSCTNGTTCPSNDKCSLTVASYNLACGGPEHHPSYWEPRKAGVKSMINFYDFDIFGTQEGFKFQLDDLVADGEYAYVGGGREDGKDKGEHSAILYKTARLNLLDQGTFWLSETPETPGLGWDAKCCFRVCSWGKFQDKESGKEFYFFNSHYDHEGVVARRESSKLVLSRIREIAGENATVFFTGDLNALPTEEPITTIASDGLFRDSYKITKEAPFGTTNTFNGWNINNPDTHKRIDYIWVTKGVEVEKYGVLNDVHYGRTPSDHYPIMANVEF